MKEVNGYNPSKDPRLLKCKTECGNEMCFAKRYGLFAEKTCQNFMEPKLQTNADRIRQMTDAELAKFLYEETDYPKEEYWLKWLKEEVTTNRLKSPEVDSDGT